MPTLPPAKPKSYFPTAVRTIENPLGPRPTPPSDVTNVFTISSGTATSSSFSLRDRHIGAIVMPAAWTAADILLEGSLDGTTFYPIYDASGSKVQVTAGTSRMIVIAPEATQGVPCIRLRSVAVGGDSDVDQAADRTINVEVVR